MNGVPPPSFGVKTKFPLSLDFISGGENRYADAAVVAEIRAVATSRQEMVFMIYILVLESKNESVHGAGAQGPA